jgi:hypothetical protein
MVERRVMADSTGKTDINHLHDVIERRVGGRRIGKTHAACHEVAGAIELGHKLIVCVTAYEQQIESGMSHLSQVLDEHGIRAIMTKRNEIAAGGAVVRFLVRRGLTEKMLGIGEYVEVDFTE